MDIVKNNIYIISKASLGKTLIEPNVALCLQTTLFSPMGSPLAALHLKIGTVQKYHLNFSPVDHGD